MKPVSRKTSLDAWLQRARELTRRSGGRPLDWLLLLVVVVLFLHNWLGGGLPTSPREEVLAEFNYAWVLREWMRQGHWLFEWNPYEFAGYPWNRYLSYPVYGVVALASLVGGFSLEGALKGFYLASFLLSALAMYELGVMLSGRREAGLLAGLVYGVFPFHIHSTVEVWVHAAFWAVLPLPFLLYEMARRSPQRRLTYQALTGLALGGLVIVNSEHALVVAPFLGLYLLLREAMAIWRGEQTLRGFLAFLTLALLVALGSSAFFTLPGLLEMRYVGITAKFRVGMDVLRSREALHYYRVSLARLVGAIIERLHLPVPFDSPDVLLGPWVLNTWYVGLVTLGLALAGLLALRKNSLVRLVALLLALAFLSSAGLMLALRIPILGYFFPFRWMIMVAFFTALLTGWGFLELSARTKGSLRAALLPGLMLLIIADYYRPTSWAFKVTPRHFYPDEVETYRWINSQGDDFRFWEYSGGVRQSFRYSYSIKYIQVPRFGGYFDNGAPVYAWLLHMRAFPPPYPYLQFYFSPFADTALDLAGVRYALFHPHEDFHSETLAKLKALGHWRVVRESEHAVVLENLTWKPLVRAYTRTAFYPGCPDKSFLILPSMAEQDVALVCGPSPHLEDYTPDYLRLYDYVLVDGLSIRDKAGFEAVLKALGSRAVRWEAVRLKPEREAPKVQMSWHRPSPEEIRIDIEAEEPVLLMVSESWYPNWRVRVDGEERELLRVNYAFMGVRLEAGRHRVTFRYLRPWYVWAGYAVSGLTLLGLALWIRWRPKSGGESRCA